MAKRLKKSVKKRPGRWVGRFWPRGAAGNFAACYALGLVLAVVATFAERAWSRSDRENASGATSAQTGIATVSKPAGNSRGTAARGALSPPAFTPAQQPTREALRQAQDLLALGRQHLSTESFSAAFEDFSRARNLIPGDPRPYHGLGEVYRRLDRAELAEKSYRKALALQPDFLSSKYHLASILRYEGKNEESVKLLRRLLEQAPEDRTFFWLELARNNLQLGKPRDAVEWLRKYTKALPENAYGQSYLGKALAESGDHEAAEKAYYRSIRLNPQQALAWLWLGQLLISEGKKDEGEAALARFRKFRDLIERARQLERDLLRRPEDFNTLMKLAKTRTQLGRYDEAIVALDRAIAIHPEEKGLLDLRVKVESLGRRAAKRRAGGGAPRQDSVVPGR